MPKIVKPGHYRERVYQTVISCQKCGCEWQVTEDDTETRGLAAIFAGPGQWYCSPTEDGKLVLNSPCPECGRRGEALMPDTVAQPIDASGLGFGA